MFRQLQLLTVLVSMTITSHIALAQKAASPRFGWQPAQGNAALRPNSLEANKAVAMTNKIVQPVPLSADSQRHALANIDRNVSEQITALGERLKALLPDEVAMLTKTTGWATEDQQALVTALRAGDPTTVYETWVKGNSKDIAGAELAAHQTDAKRLMARLALDIEKNKTALKQDVADFDMALGKIAGATPTVAEVGPAVKTLKTWIEARQLIESASPGKGAVATLPTGNDVTLVFDPALTRGVAIVLSNQAMLIGHEGDSALAITTGNAAEALGLPIVTGTPLAEEQGEEVTDGVLIVNPAGARGTINYNVNGNHYVAEPGMTQKLPPRANGREWFVEFDRGPGFGRAAYKLEPGTYHFNPTDLGWQLYRQRFEVVLDNSQSNQEFNYIFRGEDDTVPANGTKTLSSLYPIVVRFDRGNGGDFVVKSTPMTVGNLQIGVNSADNLWDLFPTTDNRREVSRLKPFNADGAGV